MSSANSAPAARPSSPKPLSSSSAWVESFDGPRGAAPDSRLFAPYESGNGQGNNELETYTSSPSNFGLDGSGHLVITARHETATGPDGYTRNWTSARLISLNKWAFTYGTLSARIKLPTGQGVWPAFWTLGENLGTVGYPAAGELDILESINAGTFAYQALHGPASTKAGWQKLHGTPRTTADARRYHVYTVVRRKDSVVYEIDGRATFAYTRRNLTRGQQWVFNEPMFILLNVAIGGNWPGSPNAKTPDTSSMYVDWIKFTP